MIIQDSSAIFSVDENDFVTYVEDGNYEEQGVKVRCCFTDTVQEIKEKIRKECGIGEDKDFELIEAQRMRSTYCQLLNPLSKMQPDAQAKDTELSHLSTWMLLMKDSQQEMIDRLLPRAGKKSYPVDIKVKIFGNELDMKLYSNMTVQEFLTNMAAVGGIEVEKMKAKIIEETKAVRIDSQIYEKETSTLPLEMRVLNTLADVKVQNNTMILCDEKTDEELNEQNQDQGDDDKAQDIELLDDSENIRTVIVNLEQDLQDIQRY